MTAQVVQQFTQKHTDLVLPDVVVEKQLVKTKTRPPKIYGNSRNDGDIVPPSLTVTMDGSLPPRF
jgi:hypothetical protein